MSNQNEQQKSNLEQCLKTRFSDEEAAYLAQTLLSARKRDSICYREIDIPEDWKDDIIMVACEERMMLPMKSRRGSAWEDRILDFAENEIYHMPRVMSFLVRSACETGKWDPRSAIIKSLEEAGEDQVTQTVELLDRIISVSPQSKIDVSRIQAIITDLNLAIDMHDTLDRFVRCGVMSACTQSSLHSGSPRYEINPSLYWKAL